MANRKSERRTSPSSPAKALKRRGGACIPRSAPATLEDLLAPPHSAAAATAEFLRSDWGRNFRHFDDGGRGKDRFAALMPWEALNQILTTEPHIANNAERRLRLTQNGKELDPSTFETPRSRVSPSRPCIDAPKLERALANGATLILDSADVSYAPLRELCANLEHVFRTDVSANLYAAWKTDTGFDLHWDSQDTLILQLQGRKHWTVWEPTIPHPSGPAHLAAEHQPKAGEHTPIFDGILEPGHMLHVPRGFWHLPRAVNEPSLHLTITVVPLTGRDMLLWLAKKSIASVAARMNVPLFAPVDQRREWIGALREHLLRAFDNDNDDVLERFLTDLDGNVPPRPRLDLPRMSPSTTERDLDVRLRLAAPRPLRLRRSVKDGRLAFDCNGSEWKTTPSARALLEGLADRRPHRLGDLIAASEVEVEVEVEVEEEDREAILDLVDALVVDRIVEVVSK